MAADDVSLPDLEVIAQFSLAVRAATAPRAQVVAALEADLRALTGSTRPGGGDAGAEPRRRAVPRPGSITRAAVAEPVAEQSEEQPGEPETGEPETVEPEAAPAPARRAAARKAAGSTAVAKAAVKAAPRRPSPKA